MQFSDTSTKSGLVEETHFFANTTSATYSINEITRNINRALDRVAFLIQSADQLWQFDDQNNTDQPIATTSLVNGQSDYSINADFLKILKIEIKDSNGNWQEVNPIDVSDPNFKRISTATTNGIPTRYDKNGNSVFLFPAPNYDSNGGLRIYYQRNMTYFVVSDTTKAPGFNPQFHRILSLQAALDLCIAKELPQATNLATQVNKLEVDLLEFYSNRGKDEPPKLRPLIVSSR